MDRQTERQASLLNRVQQRLNDLEYVPLNRLNSWLRMLPKDTVEHVEVLLEVRYREWRHKFGDRAANNMTKELRRLEMLRLARLDREEALRERVQLSLIPSVVPPENITKPSHLTIAEQPPGGN